ncbi:MAG: phosphotransferase, partial [Synechococcales cyanobacterium RU_4_20]|nr:phosphotransferase [Synechococcales cyanobacterium RU_4_20]
MSVPVFDAIAPDLTILDPLKAQSDPALSTLGEALNPEKVLQQFQQLYQFRQVDTAWPWRFGRLSQKESENLDLFPRVLKQITVDRHCPGSHCWVNYQWVKPDDPNWAYTVLGKLSAKRLDPYAYQVQRLLWCSGFEDQSPDNVSVPEPLGTCDNLHQWLQRHIPGIAASDTLPGFDGMHLVERIAQALHKLHQTTLDIQPSNPVRPEPGTLLPGTPLQPRLKHHSLVSEFKRLHHQLQILTERHPQWETRLLTLWQYCLQLGYKLGSDIAIGPKRLIHGNFHADQVLRVGRRLYLIDLEQVCWGDPALDVGCFLGHLVEQGLRSMGYSLALKPMGDRFTQTFLDLHTQHLDLDQLNALQQRIQFITSLSLVQQLVLSSNRPVRQLFTEDLLYLCESR